MQKIRSTLIRLFLSILSVLLLNLLNIGNFTLDDSYIGYKSARNFALEGNLFSYSNLDQPTNVWTSPLLYMLATLIIFVLKLVNYDTFTVYTFCILVINMLATLNSCSSTKFIVQYLIRISEAEQKRVKYGPSLKSILLFLFSCSPFLLAWLNGLETAITLSILLFVIRKIIEKDSTFLNLGLYALVLCRPEIGVCTLISVILLRKRLFTNTYKFIIKICSVYCAPFVICKIITGSFFASSIIRVPLGTNTSIFEKVILLIKQLLHFPEFFIRFFIPSEGMYYYSNLFKTLLIVSVVLIWGYVLLNIVLKFKLRNSFKGINLRLRKILDDEVFSFIIVFLISLTLALSASGSGIGENGRYFIYQFFLIIFVLIRFSFFSSVAISLLISANLLLLPATLLEVLAINNFTNNVIKPLTKVVGEIGKPDDTLALDSAGMLSLNFKGNVIDVYGLGTNRYAKIHGDFVEVYKTINIDKPDFILAWETTIPTYYLDSAHYLIAIKDAKILKIASYQSFFLGRAMAPKMGLYRVEYLS